MPIKASLPPEPEFGVPLSPNHPSPETLKLLALRRSTPVAALSEPGPAADDLDAMLRLAMRVPDHRKLEPWRVVIIEGEARARFGDVLAAAGELDAAAVFVRRFQQAFQFRLVECRDQRRRHRRHRNAR